MIFIYREAVENSVNSMESGVKRLGFEPQLHTLIHLTCWPINWYLQVSLVRASISFGNHVFNTLLLTSRDELGSAKC